MRRTIDIGKVLDRMAEHFTGGAPGSPLTYLNELADRLNKDAAEREKAMARRMIEHDERAVRNDIEAQRRRQEI